MKERIDARNEVIKELVDRATNLVQVSIESLVDLHPDIPKRAWAPAMMVVLMEGYWRAGVDPKELRLAFNDCLDIYEGEWKELQEHKEADGK